MSLSHSNRFLVSAGTFAAILCYMVLIHKISPVVSIGFAIALGAIVFGALWLILPPKKEEVTTPERISSAEVKEFLQEQQDQIAKIREAVKQAKQPVQENVQRICDVVEDCLKFIRNSKRLSRHNKRVIANFTENFDLNLERYLLLASSGSRTSRPQLEQFETVHLAQLLEGISKVNDDLPYTDSVEFQIGVSITLAQLAGEGYDPSLPVRRLPPKEDKR